MARGATIVVAGAGAVGSACALALARAGHAVTVVDPGDTPNASDVAAGMLAPAFEALFDAPDRHELYRAARDLWPSLAESGGVEIVRDGAMALGSRADAERWVEGLAQRGAHAELLTPPEAKARAPTIATGQWAAFTADDWRLDAPASLAALRSAAEALGARFTRGRVVGVAPGGARLVTGDVLSADRLVAATGADLAAQALAPEIAALSPIKGQILRAPGFFAAQPTVRMAGAYLCVGAGQAILGATMEAGRNDRDVDPAQTAELVRRGADLSAGLGAVAWRAAAGVRAATADGLPLCGPSRAEGVILAVGARRNGWLLAPMIAEVVLRTIEGRSAGEAGRLFDPSRFSRG
jgi:glycine oxidase